VSSPRIPYPYLNNVLEQDHRFVTKRMAASLWFRSVGGPFRTIAGYEAMNMVRKRAGPMAGDGHLRDPVLQEAIKEPGPKSVATIDITSKATEKMSARTVATDPSMADRIALASSMRPIVSQAGM
jgi:DDE domain